MDQFERSVVMLDEGSAARAPIAVIAIEHAVHFADLGVMDVATDDSVDAAPVCLGGDGIGERADILHCVLDPVLEISRQRPILVSQAPPHYIEMAGETKNNGVRAGSAKTPTTGGAYHRI